MLYTLPKLETASLTRDPCRLSGKALTHRLNTLGKRGRARLAAEILVGRVGVGELTVRQVAALCRVCPGYVTQARRRKATRPRAPVTMVAG
jgi:hypothetical protein